jgi:UDP-N-acetyl-D-mannosaminuronic acid dehydrogenase
MKDKNIKAVMVGLGYIGLPTAALMASRGINVHGVDINQQAVDIINQGQIHIVEPDLDGLVRHVVTERYLTAATQAAPADVFLIAVPTPFKGEHIPDISYVEDATRNLCPYLETGNLVILESTSPVGTTERVKEIIDEERPELKGKVFIAYCPERVLPGNVIYELEHNDRSIGGIDAASTEKAIEFYRHFVKGELVATNARTAEMCKLVENSSRDVNIAFANELSIICDKAGIDVWELISLANRHPRVNILQPGTGVGGHCIAVDPWFIVSEFPKEAKIIRAAREINNYKTDWVIEKVKNAALKFELKYNKKPKVACMGLAFKPDIDDLRESPALNVAKALINEGLNILAVEPNIDSFKDVELIPIEEVSAKADIVVFLVKHRQFKNINLNNKVTLDFCGL